MLLRKRRYLVLIVTLVGVLVVASFAHRVDLRSFISDLLVTLVLVTVLLAVFEGKLERTVALVVAIAAMAVTWSHHFIPHEYQAMQAVVHYVLHAFFLGFAVVVILRNVLAEKRVSADEVLGAVCGYLLAGAFWANVYALTALAGSRVVQHEP